MNESILEKWQKRKRLKDDTSLPAESIGRPLLSSAQQRMWVLNQLGTWGCAYNIPYTFDIWSSLTEASLADGIKSVFNRHDSLRTRISLSDGFPISTVSEDAVRIDTLPKGDQSTFGRLRNLRRLRAAEAERTFDLLDRPLTRITIATVESGHVQVWLTVHHIIFDGESADILIRELLHVWSPDSGEKIIKDPVQYWQYVQRQTKESKSERIGSQTDYWRTRLKGQDRLLDLPYIRKPMGGRTNKGAVVGGFIEPELSLAIKTAALAHSVTPFVFMLAAFFVLIRRFSRESDITVAVPVSGRTDGYFSQTIGPFINTVMIRASVSRSQQFTEVLSEVKKRMVEALENQDVPFERVVDVLAITRSADELPFSNVTFNFDSGSFDYDLPNAGLRLRRTVHSTKTAKCDLLMHIEDHRNTYRILISYSDDVFDRATAKQIRLSYVSLLRFLIRVDRPLILREIATLPGEPESRIAGDGLHSDPAACESSLNSLFEKSARMFSKRPAIKFGDIKWSYSQLRRFSDSVAVQILNSVANSPRFVAVYMDRSPELIGVILGILKSGAAYVPVDVDSPSTRVEYILRDSGADLLIANRKLPADLCNICKVLQIEAVKMESYLILPKTLVGGATPAYMIYTSGSTGAPKGVVVTHHNVIRLMTTTKECFSFSERDVWTLFHSYAFDFSVWEMWGALYYGGCLIVVPYLTSRNPEEFAVLLEREKVTVLNQTPSAFRNFMVAMREGKTSSLSLSLRYIILGGERLDMRSLVPWVEEYGYDNPSIINMYGITETTVHVTFKKVGRPDVERGLCSIGKPLADLVILLLDDSGALVPIGAPGELCIGGAGVAIGYWNRDDLTRERFSAHFSDWGKLRIYRSGDVARMHCDGDIEYLGRNDQQVKINGFRIELGEIEAVIRSSAYVSDCVVVVEGVDGFEEEVAAYLVAAREPVQIAEMRQYLLARLPSAYVPRTIAWIHEIPLTVNGKLDQTTLKSLLRSTDVSNPQHAEAKTLTERAFVELWKGVLGHEQFGIEDNFFAAGGDSMRAVQFVYRAKRAGYAVDVRDLFENQTISMLAKRAECKGLTSSAGGSDSLRFDLLPTARGSLLKAVPLGSVAYPATYMQRVILHEYRRAPAGAGIYHCQHAIEIEDSALDIDALVLAIRFVVRRHPSYRTNFRQSEGIVWQIVQFQNDLDIPVRELPIGSTNPEAAMLREMQSDRLVPFRTDSQEPLCRFKIFSVNERTGYLFFSCHHAIEDGWGNVEMLNELFRTYANLKSGISPEDKMAGFGQKELAALEWEAALSKRKKRFWAQKLRQCSEFRPQHRGTGSWDDVAQVTVHDEHWRKVFALASQLSVSKKAILLSVFAKSLSECFSQDIVTLGVVTNARSDRLSDPFGVLGLYWVLLPCSLQVTTPIHDLSQTCHAELLELERNAHFPIDTITHGGPSFPQLGTFNFLDFHNASFRSRSLPMRIKRILPYDRFHGPVNMASTLYPEKRQIVFTFTYDPRCVCQKQITEMKTSLRELLEQL